MSQYQYLGEQFIRNGKKSDSFLAKLVRNYPLSFGVLRLTFNLQLFCNSVQIHGVTLAATN